MSTIPELIAKLSSDQAGVDEAAGSVEASRHDVGQLIAHFEELGAGDSAAAASLRHTEEQLGHVRHGLLGGMAKAIETARRLVEQSRGHPTTAPSVPVGDPRAVVGDAITAPEPKPGPNSLRREHDDPDEGDKRRSQHQKGLRTLSRNIGDYKKASEETAKSIDKIGHGYRPERPNPGTTATVGVPEPPPESIGAGKELHVADAAATALVVTVFAAEGAARLFTRRKRE